MTQAAFGDAGVRVIRGDYRDVTASWPAESVDLIVTDPPYGHIINEAWDVAQYEELTHHIERLLVLGGSAYVWGGIGKPGNRPFFAWLAGVERRAVLTLYDLITWRKRRAYGKPDAYLFTREECAMLVKGPKPRTFHVPRLEEKRGYKGFDPAYPAKSEYLRRTNVWTDITELFQGKIHPAEKPARLAEVMIEASSNPGELVVDFFAGSGSTGVAASRLGRRCTLIEISACAMHQGRP